MAGALNYNRYPLFDMSEIIQELEFGMTRKKVLKPLRKGEQVPNFSFEKSNFRWQQFVNGVEKATTINLLQLLNNFNYKGLFIVDFFNFDSLTKVYVPF